MYFHRWWHGRASSSLEGEWNTSVEGSFSLIRVLANVCAMFCTLSAINIRTRYIHWKTPINSTLFIIFHSNTRIYEWNNRFIIKYLENTSNERHTISTGYRMLAYNSRFIVMVCYSIALSWLYPTEIWRNQTKVKFSSTKVNIYGGYRKTFERFLAAFTFHFHSSRSIIKWHEIKVWYTWIWSIK